MTTIMGRRASKRLDRREDIIDAGERVFFAKGFEGATVDDIALDAKCTKRTLYAYFPSKDQLYDAVVLRGYQVLNARSERRISEANPENGLEEAMLLGQVFIDFIQEYPHYFKAIVQYEAQSELDTASDIRIANYKEGELSTERLVLSIKKGIEDGSIRRDIDPVSTSFILYAQTVGMGIMIVNKQAYLEGFHGLKVSKMIEEMKQMIRGLLQNDV